VDQSVLAGGAGLAVTILSLLFGNGIIQSVGVSLVTISSILLVIDLVGFGKYENQIEKLTSGGLWVHELETLSGQDLDGDEIVGPKDD